MLGGVRVVYPESDGKPMRETDLHRDEMAALVDMLKTSTPISHRYGMRVPVTMPLPPVQLQRRQEKPSTST